MPTVGQAYVQIIPSAQGISGSIQKELNGAGIESAGQSAGLGFGKKMIGTIAGLGIGAAIVKGIKDSIGEGAALQQSMGGVETLFKNNADTVIKNANNAYKTAGMSANQYMETVTSFSASLLQSLGGDTGKAAQSADSALRDMSDNANKFGTDMGSIQQAYQGFAKQNYTMLDNLKLGYGGTKTEMERLLADASKLSGQQYDISSLDDVYSAIHVIQEEMGVTGTTAKEASSTFSGSFDSMKAAASNVMGALATGENLEPALAALGETMSTFISGNLIPMLGNIATQIPTLLASAVTGLTKAIPGLAKSATTMLNSFAQSITSGGGEKMMVAGLSMITKLGEAIQQNIGPLAAAAVNVIVSFVGFVLTHMPEILAAGSSIINALLMGIGAAIEQLGSVAENILNKISESISNFAQNTLKPAGERIIKAISTAVSSKFGEVTKAISTKMKSISSPITAAWSTIKSTFTGAINSIRSAVTSGFNTIKNKIMSPIKAAASRVGSTVNNIKRHLSFSGLAAKVAGVFNSVKSKITHPIESAKNTVVGIASSIVGAFSGLGRRIASAIGSIRPKVSWRSISVMGAKTPLKVPTVTFRKAMTQPYMFDKSTFFAAGEAGDEMLYGRSNLMSDIKAAVNGASAGNTITNNITVNGAENPEEWASRFARQMRMEVRMA